MTVVTPEIEAYARRGLTSAQVKERVARGLVNDVPDAPSRTVQEIVRDNVVTRFNILIAVMTVIILAVAPLQDALFALVAIINALIGITQELKAKRTLDRLALINAAKARVVRDSETQELGVGQVVLDDVLELRPGDQIVVDGEVLASRGLEVDESHLTGESDPVDKAPADGVLSGSFVVAGSGRYRATKVGRDAYAVKLAEEGKRFTLVKSELRDGIDWLLKLISWAIFPLIALVVWSQLNADQNLREALRGSVAATVGMIPQGLVLVTSVAFAVGVIRLGRRSVLVQELPAIEGLARVDTLAIDKTGTLTLGRLAVEQVELLADIDPAPPLGALVAADPNPNATLAAIGQSYPVPEGWQSIEAVPFSSARKWSGATFRHEGTWVLGAPEVLLADGDVQVRDRAEYHAVEGRRVVLLGRAHGTLDGDRPPAGIEPQALVLLADQVRPDSAAILGYFAEQAVTVKVISGDHPRTVAKVAKEVGLPGAEEPVDARSLPPEEEQLADLLEARTVYGRVTPAQKRDMVKAMQSHSHVVAMTGDGVNDVLALKDSDIGIAMGSGSPASRAVAQLVLLDSSFGTVPQVVNEGRRVIANIERVANLYLTKTIYAFLLALAIGLAGWEFPFLPRHLTLIGTVTIGIPSFFLALAPSAQRARTGFVRRVMRFAVPAGAIAAVATFCAYWLAREQPGVSLTEARTTATAVLVTIGLFVLAIISRPFNAARRVLVLSMAFLIFLAFALPASREFFELDLPPLVVVMAAIGIVAITGAIMYSVLRLSEWLPLVPEVLQSRKVREAEATVEARLSEIDAGIVGWLRNSWNQVRTTFLGDEPPDPPPGAAPPAGPADDRPPQSHPLG